MSKFARFLSTVLAVVIGNIVLFAIIIGTLYFLFKKQIENFQIDKITKTISDVQDAVGKFDSEQLKKFQEGFDKFSGLDIDSLKTQLESVKDLSQKLEEAIKQIKQIQNNPQSTSAAVSQAVSTSHIFEFTNNLKLIQNFKIY